MSRIAEQNSGPRAQGPSVRIFLSKKCIRLCPYSKKLNLFQKYSIKSIFFQKILINFKKNARELFIFQKTYTRNGLFKGRKNFLVVTASTYVKLQQAYISESVAIGDWGVIGYKGPGDEDVKSDLTGGGKSHTTNFEYTESQTFVNNTVALGSSDIIGWNAKNLAKLNDCASAINWQVKVKENTNSAGDAEFTATVLNQATCLALAPNFEKIGK